MCKSGDGNIGEEREEKWSHSCFLDLSRKEVRGGVKEASDL